MNKREWLWVLMLSILLGAVVTLALNGSGGFGLTSRLNFSQANAAQVDVPTPQVEPVSAGLDVSEILPTAASSPPEAVIAPVPEMPSVETSLGEGNDIEDVLLLYDSTRPTNFVTNFCKIAEYYGLRCKRLDLKNADITDAVLRDAQGAYFRLIGLDAAALINRPALLSAEEVATLKLAMATGGMNLLISKVNQDIDGTSLAKMTDGAVFGVVQLKPAHRDWTVSSAAPEVTREFTGQTIASPDGSLQDESTLLLADPVATNIVISSTDETGASFPVFVRLEYGLGAIFIDAGSPAGSLDQVPLRDMFYDTAHVSKIVPLMMTMRAALGDEAWHSDTNYANLTIDDPTLTEPFQKLSYIGLLGEMLAHNFHTTIALIPANWEQSETEVVSLFQKYPERFSLAQHGNNHDGYEFYKYQVTADDENQGEEYTSRPLAEQAWDIQEGLARMELLKNRTGLPFDPVMVFPYGISPEPTLRLLKQHNYLATVNAQDVPLDTERPSDWDFGMVPAETEFENFPLLTRRHLGTDPADQPDPQLSTFDLFLDKPILVFTEANEGGLFAGEITAFNPMADQINSLTGGVAWQSLGNILKRLYLRKTNDDGSLEVRMYGNDLILTNESQIGRTYHIAKGETLNVPIATLTVNGQEHPYRVEDGQLQLDVRIPAGTIVEIQIFYGD